MGITVKGDLHIQNYVESGASQTVNNYYNNGKVTPQAGELHEELQTDVAKALLEKFKKVGKLDENYQPVNQTRAYMAIMANSIAVELNLQHKWSIFEKLWGINALSSAYTRALNQKNSSEIMKEIENIITS